MIRQRLRLIAAAYLTSDLLATGAAFFIAWYVRFETGLISYTHLPEFERYLVLLPVVLVLWPTVIHFHGLYQTRHQRTRVDEALTLVIAVLLATILLSFMIAWYRPAGYERPDGTFEVFTYSRFFLGLFATLDVALVLSGRMFLRHGLAIARRSAESFQNILIIGAGALGREVARKLEAHSDLGFRVAGYLDDDPAKAGASFEGAQVLGGLEDLDRILEREQVDQVYVALPLEAHLKTMNILRTVGRECVEVKMVPDIFQYATLRAAVEDLDGTPVINLSQVPLAGWSSLAKRAIDVGLASVGAMACLPALPFVALAMWVEDRGPLFYRQERMGLDGKPFMILKLRSMRVDAEASSGPVWAVRDDPRRTRVGALLRRFSLDELPQLWNVIKGDMSIVGPRPERPAFVHEFRHRIPRYMLRHRVRAGITGWAQVHGWRGNTSVRKRIQYDLYYIENWSLKLDFKILWMTLRHGFRYNAY